MNMSASLIIPCSLFSFNTGITDILCSIMMSKAVIIGSLGSTVAGKGNHDFPHGGLVLDGVTGRGQRRHIMV